MKRIEILKQRKERLKKEISQTLEILIGTVNKSPTMTGHNLTTKVDGVTKTRHIPKDMVPLVRRMTQRHHHLKKLLKELGETNWLLIRAGVELGDYGTL